MKGLRRATTVLGTLLLAGALVCGCQGPPEPVGKEKADATPSAPAKPTHREYNDVARFLAGLPPEEGSRLAEASARPEFTKYAASFNKNWSKLDSTQLDTIRKWASVEIQEAAHDKATVFYPFAGPDFLYAYTFFPVSEKYELIGLEPVGSVPKVESMAPDAVDQLFASVNTSLDTVINFSFFKTNNMKVDLKKELDGTLPILMIFLARTGNRIDDITPIEIDGNGSVIATPQPAAAKTAKNRPRLEGVEILFQTPGNKAQKHLDYFSVNLQNDSLKQSPAFLQYVEKLGRVNTYLKSASYLMYKAYFSTIRTAILDRSAFVLEDDSAIPYKFFTPEQWDVALYGVYSQPIEMFQEHQQADLAAAYRKPGGTKPLAFGIGYQWQAGQSNLLAARKKP